MAMSGLMIISLPVQARGKKDHSNGKGMMSLAATEPDVLAAKATGERRMEHAAAVFLTNSNARINSRYKEGIDVSHYQGRIDWDAVASGTAISYAYLKATEVHRLSMIPTSEIFVKPAVWDSAWEVTISIVRT